MSARTKLINIGCGKGFVDKTPIFTKERQRIIDIIDTIYKRHGAEKLETPVFELKEVFSNKRNPFNKLLDLDDQGGEILAMRYDLKHPLTRYLSMNKIEKHMKLSQFGYVYRNEKIDIEKFRLREFFVSDFDISGNSDAMVSEVQCLRICCDILKALELNEPVHLIVGHKKITESIIRLVANINDSQAVKLIAKLSDDNVHSKINWETIESQICDNKITESVINTFKDNISSLNGSFDSAISKLESNQQLNALKEAKPIINELIQLRDFCKVFLTKVDYDKLYFDFNLIGSRNFFTGLVFAAQLPQSDINILSGGRYDNLIAKINPKSKDKISCIGFSIGVDQFVMYTLKNMGLSNEIFVINDNKSDDNTTGDITCQLSKTFINNKKEDKNVVSDDNCLKNVKGTMDRSPQQMIIREKVFNTIIECFKRHNASTIDTPVIERHDVLTGKYGEDSKLIYDLNDVDGEKLSLRYDLTVPFARYLAMHDDVFANCNLFKRYQIGKVYRRDNPSISRGRYREFYQCDFDIAGQMANGDDLMRPDYECINIIYEILRDLQLGQYKIKVNHRKFLDGLLAVCGVPANLFRTICSSIDKLDKTPWTNVRDEMISKGISDVVADKIGEYVSLNGGVELIDRLQSDNHLMSNDDIKIALAEMRVLLAHCHNIMDKVQFDLSLARGLDYYTGVIFEAVFVDYQCSTTNDVDTEMTEGMSVGSVSGGGRYDNLVNMFSSNDKIIPCVGLSIGVERLMAIYETMKPTIIDNGDNVQISYVKKQVMVISAQKNMIEERFKLLSLLLDGEITAMHSMKKNPKSLDVFQECEALKIPLAVIIGEDELRDDCVKLRYIATRKEELVKRSDIVARLRSELAL